MAFTTYWTICIFVVFACINADDDGSLLKLVREPIRTMPMNLELGVHNQTVRQPLSVRVRLTITHLSELDPSKNEMSTNVNLHFSYKDSRLSFNPELEEGIHWASVPIRYIWTPDIYLYNSAEKTGGKIFEDKDTLAKITSNGEVLVVFPMKLKSFCNLNYTTDGHLDIRQDCSLTFGSWVRDETEIDIQLDESETIDDFSPNPCWHLTGMTREKIVKRYVCCPEPWGSLKFNLHWEKRAQPSHACKF